MEKGLFESIKKIIPEERILRDEAMHKHTTFRTGGRADYFILPENREELKELILFFRREGAEYFVIGNGSNLLVSDEGYRGAIICTAPGFTDMRLQGLKISVGAGMLLSRTAAFAQENGLTGLEFASGIPGTVGGAMVMNAGAYGGEMKDIVESVEVLSPDGEVKTLSVSEMGFGYRKSIVKDKGYTVLETVFLMREGVRDSIKEKMDELSNKRKEKQPLNYPSAGSTFKRPEGNFAGKLIMEAGLSGHSIGGAMVSEKHCGFIVNSGNATSNDVYRLILHVEEQVEKKFNVKLEPEICFLGEF